MKKFFILLTCLLVSISRLNAQGTITFQNSASTLIEIGTVDNQGNYNGQTTPAGLTSTQGWKIQLYYQLNNGGTAPNPLSYYNGNWEAISTLANIAPVVGRFSDELVTGADVYGYGNPSGNVWLEAVAWNNNAPSLNAAFYDSTLIGYSSVWGQATGNPNANPPTPPVSTTSFPGISILPIPEPSAVALTFMGLGSCLIFHRQKSICL